MPLTRRELIQGAAAGGAGVVVGGAGMRLFTDGGETDTSGLTGDIGAIAEERGLSPLNVSQAVRSFTAPGEHDEFLMFASGGHAGQIIVMGVPSLRVLKIIGVFTPEPWQGYGYGSDWSEPILDQGSDNVDKTYSEARGRLSWADTHHPALSETGGEYDGRYVYINDRANGRIAMVDLRDFKTKEIWDIPNLQSSHGGVFVTPNTDYAHISTKTPTLVDFTDIENCLESEETYAASFRGFSTFCAINPQNGRFDKDRSFQIELPPYTQDLADCGKLVSDGWAFINSYNTELARGGVLDGEPPLEVGMSQAEFDYLHLINWRKAEEVAAAGGTVEINGMRVIPMETAISEKILFLAPEPRSPHGVDVSPDGNYLCIGGKLDPHVTIFGFDKILAAIEAEDFEDHDRYGIPILRFDSIVAGRVELGAGPLHTQFDSEGHGYTSLFIESAVAKFSLGEPYFSGDDAFQLVDKVSVHYNIGHLVTMEGDTVSPQDKYLVALNKWSLDRFPVVGTLKPQNFQLVDLSGEQMELLSDSPIGFGEPHYVQCMRADRLNAWEVYPPGVNPKTMEVDENAIVRGEERIERSGNNVEVWMSVHRSTISPDHIKVNKGDHVVIHITNTESTPDATHGFSIPRYNISLSLDAGEVTGVEFEADVEGAFAMYCTEFCSALHLEMQGWMLVS
jgi:nitrous-oxide reductase